jgi:hypothetical protein
MNEPETYGEHILADWWLGIATANLSAPAKQRIRLEIEAHYADGVESHLANGCSEDRAHAAALAELGDPIAAAKSFRRRHLTITEAKRVRGILHSVGSIFWLVLRCILPANAMVVMFCFRRQQHIAVPILPSLAFLICVGLASSGFYLARRKTNAFETRLILLTHFLYGACFWISLCVWSRFWDNLLFFSLFTLTQLLPLSKDLSIWFKLGQTDPIWPKLPSRGAPAS